MGLGMTVSTMGQDVILGFSHHNLFNNRWVVNLYGNWEYRIAGIENYKSTGSLGMGIGLIHSLISFKKPIYFNKKKKQFFQHLGIGVTFDFDHKFSADRYIGNRHGLTVWSRLNQNMLGFSFGVDITLGIFPSTYFGIRYIRILF